MDNSTILFVVTLVVAFVILRWLISPIPQSVPEEFNIPDPTRQDARVDSTNTDRRRTNTSREVTLSMIEVVHAIAPQLTSSQIRFSLQRTGSVEATVEEYMENGSLPYPPGETPTSPVMDDAESHNVAPNGGELHNLLEKYGLDANGTEVIEDSPVEGKWGKDKSERLQLLQKRREDMIIKARRRMQKSLSNDVFQD